jgi:hypothetical protein
MREVGALLDARAVHGGRSAYNHLLCLAQTNNLPRRRVGEVLELVGLTEVARRRSKGFSLGMSQRLGIAGALLGDPAVLMFDEPINGLDPEGILWIRTLMKELAAEGCVAATRRARARGLRWQVAAMGHPAAGVQGHHAPAGPANRLLPARRRGSHAAPATCASSPAPPLRPRWPPRRPACRGANRRCGASPGRHCTPTSPGCCRCTPDSDRPEGELGAAARPAVGRGPGRCCGQDQQLPAELAAPGGH